VHRLLWSRAEDRLRVQLNIGELAKEYDVYYSLMNEAIARMTEQGRIRYVACNRGKRYIYEITNPNTYDRSDANTHAQRSPKPLWG
jgi:hypothetical protein